MEGFGEGDDLPEVAIVPHELSATEEGTVFERDALGVMEHLGLVGRIRDAMDADDGAGHAIGFDVAEEEVMSPVFGGCGDLDAFGVGVGFPGVLGLGWVKNVADELAAMPGEVGDILAGEEDDPSFVRQGVWEDEACAVGVDGGVGLERDGAFAVQLIIAGWKGDVSRFGEEVCEEVCIVCGGGEESGGIQQAERE